MNESTKAMIEKLHARLNDLSEVVDEIPFELNGYDRKLDNIDDQVYLIEVKLEKKLESAKPLEKVSAEDSKAFDEATTEGPEKATKTTSTASEISDEASDAPSAKAVESAESSSSEGEKEKEGFLTDSAKETIAGATKTLNSLYKDGKEVFGEFSEAFSDVKEVFGGGKKFFKK